MFGFAESRAQILLLTDCTCQYILLGNTLGLTGTSAFASIHSHLGFELGRHDRQPGVTRVYSHLFSPWFFAVARPRLQTQ